MPYGKPTTLQLRDNLLNKYGAESNPEQYYLNSIINFIGFKDIEHILQCIREIDDFFTTSAYGGVYLLDKLQLRDARRPWELNTLTTRIRDIRKIVEDQVFKNYSWNHSFDDTLAQIFNEFFNLIKRYSKEIHVFTTNYDRAVEEYCSVPQRNCRKIDGFSYDEDRDRRLWEGIFKRPQIEGRTNVCLYKLHGSLNWKKHRKYGIETTAEERRFNDPSYEDDLLIYPTLSPKEGEEIEPYKTVREEFRKYMQAADVCIVIGFSFRDQHLNTIFSDFFKQGKSIIVVSPSADKNIFTHLIKKDIPEPEKEMTHSVDRNKICLFRENKRIITINQPLSSDNSTEITRMIASN